MAAEVCSSVFLKQARTKALNLQAQDLYQASLDLRQEMAFLPNLDNDYDSDAKNKAAKKSRIRKMNLQNRINDLTSAMITLARTAIDKDQLDAIDLNLIYGYQALVSQVEVAEKGYLTRFGVYVRETDKEVLSNLLIRQNRDEHRAKYKAMSKRERIEEDQRREQKQQEWERYRIVD